MREDKPISVPEQGLAGAEEIPTPLANRVDRILIPEHCIQARVRGLAHEVSRDYPDTKRLTLLIVLDGAIVFAADLGREIHRAGGPEVDYRNVKARTYGDEIKGSGEMQRRVEILVEPPDIEGRDVLLIEDIVDQGFTLATIQQILLEKKPASLRTCALLWKRLDAPTQPVQGLRDSLEISYVGFDVPDRWVAGYGIDVSHEFRELPFIVAVHEAYYSRK